MGFVDNIMGTNIFGPNSTDRAIDAQTGAAREANATQKYMYDQTREDLAPYREAGVTALAGIESGDFAKDLTMDPGYKFRMESGRNALEGSASARGQLNSGATLKQLARYGQDFGSNEYSNAYNREFGRLSSLAGIGAQGMNQTVNAGENYANNVSGIQMGLGNARAAAHIGTANRQANLMGQGAGAAAMAFSDIRVKEKIEPVSKEDLNELKRVVKPYHFKYIDSQYGQGPWVGVMAQDLEKTKLGKTVVFTDENGIKKVDLKKLYSILVTSLLDSEVKNAS